jgi:hypothetical protein
MTGKTVNVGKVFHNRILKLCRQQTEVIQNHENANVHDNRKSEAQYRKCKRHNRGNGQAYNCSSDDAGIVT